MNKYKIRYISGAQLNLSYSQEEVVLAPSLTEALRGKSSWEVEENVDKTYAMARHPGLSIYDLKAWEAKLIK